MHIPETIITKTINQILAYYEGDSQKTLDNLSKILMHGELGGSGKLLILAVDQGFEHGPDKSFSANPEAYDPHYFFQLACEGGISALAAPIGIIESGVKTFAAKVPTILKLNSNNSLAPKSSIPDQAITSSVKDAIGLGCSAVGFTIYPGSPQSHHMIEEAANIISEAKSYGLPTVIWAYPRGGDISKKDETSLETISYAAHIAALLGAHIIKVKIPSEPNIKHLVRACFNGKKILLFSGGVTKTNQDVTSEIHAISNGNGYGSMIGRNLFQRPKQEALDLIKHICDIYKREI